jgi:hypothetical protein
MLTTPRADMLHQKTICHVRRWTEASIRGQKKPEASSIIKSFVNVWNTA